jgi:hypothetical protein
MKQKVVVEFLAVVEMAIEQSDAKTTRDAVAEIQHLSNSAPEQLHVTGVIPLRVVGTRFIPMPARSPTVDLDDTRIN